jgi:hypothetical protein
LPYQLVSGDFGFNFFRLAEVADNEWKDIFKLGWLETQEQSFERPTSHQRIHYFATN